MRSLIILLFFLFTIDKGYSQTTIPLEDVGKHIGDSVFVCVKVSGGRFLEKLTNEAT